MASDGHGGKISGKLKDALPVIPDKVVEAIEAGKDVPVEALVSPGAFEAHMEAEERRKAPVRMQDLTPVTKNDPRIRDATTFNGTSLPAVPSTRRVIPAPYRRPRIEIGHHGKTWQRLEASEVKKGDIVRDVGLVACDPELETQYLTVGDFLTGNAPVELSLDTPVAHSVDLVITGVSGERHHFGEHDRLDVFTKTPE